MWRAATTCGSCARLRAAAGAPAVPAPLGLRWAAAGAVSEWELGDGPAPQGGSPSAGSRALPSAVAPPSAVTPPSLAASRLAASAVVVPLQVPASAPLAGALRGRGLHPHGRRRLGTRGGHVEEDEEVTLTHARLEQLLEAEITTLGLRDSRPMTLQSILNSTRHAGELADMLHEELPVRYAQRIKMLEALPDWREMRSIAVVREMYVTSFKELRLADPKNLEEFTGQLRSIKKRHAHTNLLVGGFKAYAQNEELGEVQINEWLDRFFALRISTNMLIAHYLEIASGRRPDADEGSEEVNPYQSSINPRCHPYRIAKHAAVVIRKLCEQWYGWAPEIHVQDVGSQPFPFVPRYLFYILSELLKNAVRATIEKHVDPSERIPGLPVPLEAQERVVPVQVLVGSGSNVSSIRISDQGGGIPVDQLSHVWSYLYTTAAPIDFPRTREGVDAPTDLRRVEMGALHSVHSLADGDEEQNVLMRSPLAGLGCGLPLSRLYAQYLGGDVVLHTLPNYGVDVFVYLNSLGNHMEELPHGL